MCEINSTCKEKKSQIGCLKNKMLGADKLIAYTPLVADKNSTKSCRDNTDKKSGSEHRRLEGEVLG
jgi:hypothetical protein